MTSRALPSDEELVERLRRRILSVEGGEGLVKRFNRNGVPSRLKNKRLQSDQVDANAAKYVVDIFGQLEVTESLSEVAPHSVMLRFPTCLLLPIHLHWILSMSFVPLLSQCRLQMEFRGPDVSYFANITVGTPPRGFLILLDSGSADFWIGSETCTSSAGGGCVRRFLAYT